LYCFYLGIIKTFIHIHSHFGGERVKDRTEEASVAVSISVFTESISLGFLRGGERESEGDGYGFHRRAEVTTMF